MSGLAPGEIRNLLLMLGDARSVLEIGTFEGMTAWFALAFNPFLKRYVGVDVLPGYKTGLAVQQQEVLPNPGNLVVGDSRFQLVLRPRGSFDLTASDLLPKFDAIFIDGDHSRAAVEHDTALAESLVADPGIIIWHDYGNPDAEVTEFLKARGGVESFGDSWLAFQQFGRRRFEMRGNQMLIYKAA